MFKMAAALKNLLSTSDQVAPLRVVLLGSTGSGKSTTANTLIGAKKFKSAASRDSVTSECSVEEVNRFGTSLVVVDTPGIFDTTMSEDDLKVQLMESTHLACPGVHAFLLVMKIGERSIDEKDRKLFDKITKLLGKEFLGFTIVVFTGKESLDEDEVDVDQFISGLPDTCKDFLKSCKGGYLAISNVCKEEKEQAALQVIDKVKDLTQKNVGGYYQNILFDEQNEEIRKKMEIILKKNDDVQNKINQAETEKQRLMAKFKDHKLNVDQRKELKKIENDLSELRKILIDRKVARIAANREIQRAKTMKKVLVVGGVSAAAAAVGAAAVTGSPATVVAGLVAVASKVKLG